MTGENDAVLDAITRLLPRLLVTMDTLAAIARHMHPPRLSQLVDMLGDHDAQLRMEVDAFRAVAWPESLAPFRDQLDQTAGHALRACEGLRVALEADNPMLGSYRAMRHASRAIEALYPVAAVLPTVSQYFLEPAARDDAVLLERLRRPGTETGVMHSANETGQRGGFSVYVPEYHDASRPAPLIVALHGGAGHGRLFLWTWLREARTRGAILIAPTAIGDTWSLMEPDIDATNIARIVEEVGRRWPIDPSHRLLTGMSDGGTFTLLSGLHEEAPFTHLAPVAASFHPMLLAMTEPQRIRGLPIMLTHGALDWMFPVSVGRTANRALQAAGAAVVYREIEDLSHAYPRAENSGIMDWFLGA